MKKNVKEGQKKNLKSKVKPDFKEIITSEDPIKIYGGLSQKTKELLALENAISECWDGCIASYTHDALTAGALPREVAETIGVAIMLGGRRSLSYGEEAFEALDQFYNENGFNWGVS